jgi:hypothetical protein
MFGSLHNGGKIGKTMCTKNETLIKRLHHGWKIEEKSFKLLITGSHSSFNSVGFH